MTSSGVERVLTHRACVNCWQQLKSDRGRGHNFDDVIPGLACNRGSSHSFTLNILYRTSLRLSFNTFTHTEHIQGVAQVVIFRKTFKKCLWLYCHWTLKAQTFAKAICLRSQKSILTLYFISILHLWSLLHLTFSQPGWEEKWSNIYTKVWV